MKILLCHNYYQQRGGEDESFESEARLLAAHGHEVLCHTRHNDEISRMSRWSVARRTLFNRDSYRELRACLRRERPDLVHCTNTFPLISPAVYRAAHEEAVPVVQSLRNYRSSCANGYLFRGGRVCEECLGRRLPWPAVRHRCYRGSRAGSAVLAALQIGQRLPWSWSRTVKVYFTLTRFARQKLIEGGMPAGRIAVKPNFLETDPGVGNGNGEFFVFVGRLSPEKGIATLLAAWSELTDPPPLVIIGDGPLAPQVREAAAANPQIEWRGRRDLDEVLQVVGDAAALVCPSLWYETFGRTAMEAFARGTPVIASDLGALAELVDDGRTGLLCAAGSATDLASKVRRLRSETETRRRLRLAARAEYEQRYTAAANYRLLRAIYDRALGPAAGSAAARGTSAKAGPGTNAAAGLDRSATAIHHQPLVGGAGEARVMESGEGCST